jgi:hypothetical protein
LIFWVFLMNRFSSSKISTFRWKFSSFHLAWGHKAWSILLILCLSPVCPLSLLRGHLLWCVVDTLFLLHSHLTHIVRWYVCLHGLLSCWLWSQVGEQSVLYATIPIYPFDITGSLVSQIDRSPFNIHSPLAKARSWFHNMINEYIIIDIVLFLK